MKERGIDPKSVESRIHDTKHVRNSLQKIGLFMVTRLFDTSWVWWCMSVGKFKSPTITNQRTICYFETFQLLSAQFN